MLLRMALAGMVLASASISAQVIEFEHNGLKYQTLTHSGVTVMYAHLAAHVKEYSIIQVSVSNGSAGPYTIRPPEVEGSGSIVPLSILQIAEYRIDFLLAQFTAQAVLTARYIGRTRRSFKELRRI